jgi:hypothetical protein
MRGPIPSFEGSPARALELVAVAHRLRLGPLPNRTTSAFDFRRHQPNMRARRERSSHRRRRAHRRPPGTALVHHDKAVLGESTGALWTNSERLVHCVAGKDRAQRRSSAQGDLRGPHHQDEIRRTADLGLFRRPIMDRPRRDSRQGKRNHGSRPVSTDFCNKIRQKQPCADTRRVLPRLLFRLAERVGLPASRRSIRRERSRFQRQAFVGQADGARRAPSGSVSWRYCPEESDTMTTISAKSDVVTLIKVFTVEPGGRQAF